MHEEEDSDANSTFFAPLNLFWTWSGHCFVKKFVAKKSLRRELENDKANKIRNIATDGLQSHYCTFYFVDVSKFRKYLSGKVVGVIDIKKILKSCKSS